LSVTDIKESVPTSLVTESPWHNFAAQDAYTYILTGIQRGDRQEFWASGEHTVRDELLPIIEQLGVERHTALEIGCGVGRLLFPMSKHFEKVVGLDIAPEMIRQARLLASERRIANADLFSISQLDPSLSHVPNLNSRVDFIYSLLVFQHIEEFAFIEKYLGLVRACLSRMGVAYLQFDTRTETPLYRLKNILPDSILPPYLRRGIRRIRRRPSDLERSFKKFGLAITKNIGQLSKYHCYVLRAGQSCGG